GHSGLDDDGARLRVDADGEVVQRDLQNVVADLFGLIRVVRQGLEIGDQEGGVVRMLERHAGRPRPRAVPKMERSGGSVARQDGSSHDSLQPPAMAAVSRDDEAALGRRLVMDEAWTSSRGAA